LVHGEKKYDYSKVDYKHSKSKVVIICPIHGEFEQNPNNHLHGQGCPKCGYDKIRKLRANTWKDIYGKEDCILYLIECFDKEESFLKIGVTARSVKERYSGKKAMPYKYNILYEGNFLGEIAEAIESDIIKLFKSYRPFQYFGGISECLDIHENINILKYLKS